jgi:transcriptional regulator with XRE-family HTH domain
MNRKNQIAFLCQFLREWRKSRQISQEHVQRVTGIDVSNYEITRSEPGLYNILILCEFYGISFPWLCGISEDVTSGGMSEESFLQKAKR